MGKEIYVGVVMIGEELEKKGGAGSVFRFVLMFIRALSRRLGKFSGSVEAFLETLRYVGEAGNVIRRELMSCCMVRGICLSDFAEVCLKMVLGF